MSNPFGPAPDEDEDNAPDIVIDDHKTNNHKTNNNDDDDDYAPDIAIDRHAMGRQATHAITQKPLIPTSVPSELCGPTADFNPFQFWNRDKWSEEVFGKWNDQIGEAIQTAVNEYHRGFNQATTEFDEILRAFEDSELKLKRLNANLLEARKLLDQTRGEKGTSSIAEQWEKFESYKKKLKELDKIEYILEIPQIFEKYLNKKQFIHATVLLEDGLALYATSLTLDSTQQLQSSHQIILKKKNELEKLLSQQLYQQIYFKTNSLRSNLLRPPKRKTNKNIVNLLNFQKEMMMMEEEEVEQDTNEANINDNKSNSLTSPHYKNTKSVHYDTLASLNRDTTSIGIGSSAHKSKFKSSSRSGKGANIISSHATSTSLQDPYKIIVPTYKSFRNLDDVKDDSVQPQIFGNVQHLLVAETTDEYLKLAHNNNNYNDDEQPLFLTICVTAIDKLGRSVGAKTNLFKSLDVELKEIIDREIYEICNSFQQQMIQSNTMSNMIEPEDQSIMLLNAAQNVFKIFTRVLSNHKTVFNVFESTELRSFSRKSNNKSRNTKADKIMKLKQYSIQSVWNGIQKSILNHLLIRYFEQTPESKDQSTNKKGANDGFLDTVNENYESEENILKVRSSSRSASPQPSPGPQAGSGKDKSFASRLKGNKFFKRARKGTKDFMGGDNNNNNNNNRDDIGGDEEKGYNGSGKKHSDDIGKDLFAAPINNKLHDIAMDGLTFSFADSNIGSIALKGQGLHTNTIDKNTRQEFGGKKRISLSNANAFQNLAGIQTRSPSSSIMNLGIIPQGRERSGTGLDAFSQRARNRGTSSYGKHQTRNNMMNKSKIKSNNKDDKLKKQKSVKAKRRKQLNLIEPSPYHVTKLYKPVIHFVENAEWKIMGLYGDDNDDLPSLNNNNTSRKPPSRREMEAYHEKRKKEAIDDEIDLREFLKNFVKKTFIPNMRAEASIQMAQVLLENQPMDQIRLSDEALLLMKSTAGIFDLIKTLFDYFKVLPVFDAFEFVAMIQKILSSYLDAYNEAIDEISGMLISRDLIYSSNNYIKLLDGWNLRSLFENSEKISTDDESSTNHTTRAYEQYNSDDDINIKQTNIDKYSYEIIKERNKDLSIQHFLLLKNEDKIPMSHSGVPTFNTEHYSKLALISTGLFWMSKKITSELITPITHNVGSTKLRKSTTSHVELSKLCQYLSDKFEPRAEQCISIIRMEIRSQIVCLLKNISKNNYWMPEDSIINKPQDFIITLNKLLVSCEGKLSGCLPEIFIRFLFIEMAYFICEVIIDQIPRVINHKINIVGYKQLYKNTFSLQQNLTTITQKGMEKCFDRAQKYLKLSQKTPEDIEKIQEIKNKKYGSDKEKYAAYNFTKDQYAAITQVAKFSNAHRK